MGNEPAGGRTGVQWYVAFLRLQERLRLFLQVQMQTKVRISLKQVQEM